MIRPVQCELERLTTIIEEGVDATIVGELRGDVIIGVRTCGRDELCEEECI